MPLIDANGVRLEYQLRSSNQAPSGAPVVLMIMGLGMQLTAWPEDLLNRLHDGGLRTLVYDQRDMGLSSRMDQLGTPSFLWSWLKKRLGVTLKPPYTMADLARDANALARELGIKRMHVLGISMGGMVAQHVAATNPDQVQSLTLLMSTSGATGLPSASRSVTKVMLAPMPKQEDHAALVERFVTLFQAIGSPRYPTGIEVLRERARLSVQRGATPRGTQRQVLAILADGDRSKMLAKVRVPTLVVHGSADPLLPLACGRDLAEKIPRARLVTIDGMGHDLPDALLPELAELIIDHCSKS